MLQEKISFSLVKILCSKNRYGQAGCLSFKKMIFLNDKRVQKKIIQKDDRKLQPNSILLYFKNEKTATDTDFDGGAEPFYIVCSKQGVRQYSGRN